MWLVLWISPVMKKTYDTYKERVDFKVITGDGETNNIDKIDGSFTLNKGEEVNGGYLRVSV